MNVTSLPAGGANFRVYKTTANGSDFFGNAVALTLGSNTITVGAVGFDRAVKFQFSSGAVDFDALSVNGVASSCVVALPPPTTTSIGACGDFVSGPSAWPHVLVATTVADGATSQGAQTFTMNVTSLPAGGANFRVYKTTANGSDFFGNAVALTLGSNTITVGAVGFDRAVKFQFSSGAVDFDALSVNGVGASCVGAVTPPTTSLISACGDFVSGPSAWPYVLVATTAADGAASQAAQTFTMNVTSLPAGGANVRVYKTTANGSAFFANPVALGLNTITMNVAAVGFDRAVKFQFSSGDVEFDALSLNGVNSTCVGSTPAIPGCTDPTAFNYDPSATVDDGSCVAVVNGCTDPTAFNYNAAANTDDGSCMSVVLGCTDPTATNYNASANTDDGSCIAPACCNSSAYGSVSANSYVTVNISSCNYLSEYSSISSVNPGETYILDCQMSGSSVGYVTVYEGSNCGTPVASGTAPLSYTAVAGGNIYAHWTVDGACVTAAGCHETSITGTLVPTLGCTDPIATNYDPLATC